jgi:DNA-binding response OmpR family regulator
MKILLAEDDKTLGEKFKKALEKIGGCQVTHIEDGEDAFNEILMDKEKYDVYLLDINLPTIDGLKLIKAIRAKDEDAIIIMVTASADVEDMEKAYGISVLEDDSKSNGKKSKKIKLRGCDDYLKKPVKAEEILLRIKHHMQLKEQKCAKENQKRNKVVIDNMEFYFDTMDLYINGVIVNLRKKEKRLLNILLENMGRTVKHEDIINFVWEGRERDNYPLRQLVSDLKRKLPRDYITSEVGIGYRFDKK